MRIALVESSPKSRVYPLGLLKIGAWRQSLGDECELFLPDKGGNRLPEAGRFDEIWITTLFTFDIPHAAGIVKHSTTLADRVLVGGISATLLPQYFERAGAEVHQGLLSEAEAFSPDLWSVAICAGV